MTRRIIAGLVRGFTELNLWTFGRHRRNKSFMWFYAKLKWNSLSCLWFCNVKRNVTKRNVWLEKCSVNFILFMKFGMSFKTSITHYLQKLFWGFFWHQFDAVLVQSLKTITVTLFRPNKFISSSLDTFLFFIVYLCIAMFSIVNEDCNPN